uniref:Glutathione peroxidase 3 n=1 Tax=Cyprinodon variegatus TaxID=28743 RepID=A0A3Q2CZ65_CYPVA
FPVELIHSCLLYLCFFFYVCFCLLEPQSLCDRSTEGTIYKYQARTLNGSLVSFGDFAGKTILFINVATY